MGTFSPVLPNARIGILLVSPKDEPESSAAAQPAADASTNWRREIFMIPSSATIFARFATRWCDSIRWSSQAALRSASAGCTWITAQPVGRQRNGIAKYRPRLDRNRNVNLKQPRIDHEYRCLTSPNSSCPRAYRGHYFRSACGASRLRTDRSYMARGMANGWIL